MIDVHVIRYHSLAKPELFERCATSLAHPAVNIYEVEGYKDPHFGELRIQGFSKGDSKYVTFLDDDDYLHPGAIDTLLTAIGDKDYAISGYSIDSAGPFVGIMPDTLDFKVAKKRLYYFQGFKIIKRTVVEKYFDLLKKTKYFEDSVLWLSLTKNHDGIIVNKPLLCRTVHSNNATKTLNMNQYYKTHIKSLTSSL